MPPKPIIELEELLLSLKAKDVMTYECPHLDYADHVMVVSGLSSIHLKSLAHKVHQSLKEKKITPLNALETSKEDNWLILDYGEFIIHFFLPETRKHYDIEGLLAKAQAKVRTFSEDV